MTLIASKGYWIYKYPWKGSLGQNCYQTWKNAMEDCLLSKTLVFKRSLYWLEFKCLPFPWKRCLSLMSPVAFPLRVLLPVVLPGLMGSCLVHVHLNIQTNTWDDPYTDFWNSVFEHLSPPWYSCFSNCIYFQSSSLSSTQQNHCALLEFSFFVMSVHKEPPGRKLGHLRTQFICFLFPRNRVPYSLFNFW